MKTAVISRIEAYRKAGEMVTETLIAERMFIVFPLAEDVSSSAQTRARGCEILRRNQVFLSGHNAVRLWVEEPSDDLVSETRKKVIGGLSQLTNNEADLDAYYAQANLLNLQVLAQYRHTVESLVSAMLKRGRTNGKDLIQVVKTALSEQYQHRAVKIAGHAIAARLLGADLGNCSADPKEYEDGSWYYEFQFPRSDGLADEIRLRYGKQVSTDSVCQARDSYLAAVLKTGRNYSRGLIGAEQYLNESIAAAKRYEQHMDDFNILYRNEYKAIIEQNVAVHVAGDIAEEMIFGHSIADEARDSASFETVARIAGTGKEGLDMIAAAKQRVRFLLELNAKAVYALAELLLRQKDLHEDVAEDIVDFVIQMFTPDLAA